MKTIASELGYFFRGRARRNLKLLAGYVAFLAGLIVAYAWLFDVLMWRLEGRRFSFISGLYWTVTAMTTLGFGDITFESDGGRLFSAIVTMSGVVFLLVFLPFGMITLFAAPWLEERLRYRPPTEAPRDTRDHVIIAGWDALTRTLAGRLRATGIGCVVLEGDFDRAVRMAEEDIDVVHGIPTDAQTLERARVDHARAVVANVGDTANVNLTLTARSATGTPVIAIVDEPGRVEIMELAGADHIVPLKEMLGRQLAVRATVRGAFAHVLDSYDELLFAEMPVRGEPLEGKTVAESRLREDTGVSLIGLWKKGAFLPAAPDALLGERTIILFAGTREQLEAAERHNGAVAGEDLIIILGYGTVGRSAARFLSEGGINHRMVDLAPPSDAPPSLTVTGDACDRDTLDEAGVGRATGVLVTTNDDGTNVFLTLVCRHVNPDLRIVARANREENVSELYAAGADLVVSLVSLGATVLMNLLRGKETTFLTEGVNVFWRGVPESLVGKSLAQSEMRTRMGATIVAVRSHPDEPLVPARADLLFEPDMELLLVGSPEAEEAFSRLGQPAGRAVAPAGARSPDPPTFDRRGS